MRLRPVIMGSSGVVVTETTSQRFDQVLRDIESLGVGSPEYHEALWMLLSVMARRQACIADTKRRDRRIRERAAATRAQRKEAKNGE